MAVHAMQGNQASSLAEGEVSLFFSSFDDAPVLPPPQHHEADDDDGGDGHRDDQQADEGAAAQAEVLPQWPYRLLQQQNRQATGCERRQAHRGARTLLPK